MSLNKSFLSEKEKMESVFVPSKSLYKQLDTIFKHLKLIILATLIHSSQNVSLFHQ